MRLIDADEIIYESIDSCDTGRHESYYGTGILAVRKEDLDDMPTIEERTGHWIPVPAINKRGGHECSLCHSYAPSYKSGDEMLSDWCPSCGARMIEKDGETERKK